MLNYTIMYSGATHLLTKRHKNLFIMIFLKSIPSYPKYKIWRSSGSYCLSLNTKDEMKRKGVLLPGKSITVQYDNFFATVCTLFWTKNSRTFQGHISHFSRTPFDAKKKAWVYVYFQFCLTTRAIGRSFCTFAPFRYMKIQVGQS